MPDDPARLLWTARQNGTVVPRAVLEGITGIADAYAVQTRQIAQSGKTVGGFKLGATAAPVMAALAVDEPFIGPVLEEAIFASGARVPVHLAHAPHLECEFALRLAAPLPRGRKPIPRGRVRESVKSVHAAFEIIAVRIAGGPRGAGPLLIADNAANGGLVLGGEIPLAALDDGALEVRLEINGRPAARGAASALLWEHVLDAVGWLAARQHLACRPPDAGDLVLTGTVTGLAPISPGDMARADFGGLATVDAAITLA